MKTHRINVISARLRSRWFATLVFALSLSATWGAQLGTTNPPVVTAFKVNNDQVQRSMVTSLSFQFSVDVGSSLQAADLLLLNRNSGTVIDPTNFTLAYKKGSKLATWTFPKLPGKSLPDGNYLATLVATSIVNIATQYLDGNRDKFAGDNFVTNFFRYFGDADGDRDVDGVDLFKFRSAYAARRAASGAPFDFDGDRIIGTNDLAKFREHYLTRLSATISPITIFSALADCSPTMGAAPLRVALRSRATFTGGSIVEYRWDFTGDGISDTFDQVARDYTYTYPHAGSYQATLAVRNNLNQWATNRCLIVVTGSPPSVVASALPSNGQVPLSVNFSASATDPDGSVVKYEWDFNGDGIYDFTSASSAATFTYTNVGNFAAVCRVTDNDGLTATGRTSTTTVRAGVPGSPSVIATASPATGNAPLLVSFNGSATDDGTIVLWEWDFDGNGVFDYSSSNSPVTSFLYTNAGIYAAALRVTDDIGLHNIDNVEVIVNFNATLAIPNDTFAPDTGATVAINSSVNSRVPVRLFLRNKAGATVRTLVTATRSSGNYSDVWDGRDANGQPLPEGTYYAVLEYVLNGETKQLDLTFSTGSVTYTPTRNTLPSVFSPFNNNLLPITFTVPGVRGASEVTAFVGRFNVDTRFITLLERVPFGVGTYTIYWDGLDVNGNFAVPPAGDSFLFGMTAYTLPDNAIYLRAAPNLSNLFVSPTVLDPSLDPGQTVSLAFNLDKAADIDLTVTSLRSGQPIRHIRLPNVAAGNGRTVAWDGKSDEGVLAARGNYRLGLKAIDVTGGESITRYVLMKITY